MKSDFARVEDKINQLSIKLRESAPVSFSKIFMELNKRIEGLEKFREDHAKREEEILKGVVNSIESLKEEQRLKHNSIDEKLTRLEPAADGIAAAKTLRKGAVWLVGFIASIIALTEYLKWIKK